MRKTILYTVVFSIFLFLAAATTTSIIAKVKAVFRKGLEKKNNVPTVPTRQAEIAALEQELAALMALLKGTK